MKKIIYILAWIFLGILLSFLTHAALEISYIKYALANDVALADQSVFGHAYCALPGIVQIGLLLAGAVFGLWAGMYFWKAIYIEKRYRKIT